jgi:hypothetical protein
MSNRLIYPVKIVSKDELRQLFNEQRYWERAEAQEFRQQILKDGHPSPPLAKEPFCTKSQIVAYINRYGKQVATVHQYRRPDGSIGLSGRPDPTTVLFNLELYTTA